MLTRTNNRETAVFGETYCGNEKLNIGGNELKEWAKLVNDGAAPDTRLLNMKVERFLLPKYTFRLKIWV